MMRRDREEEILQELGQYYTVKQISENSGLDMGYIYRRVGNLGTKRSKPNPQPDWDLFIPHLRELIKLERQNKQPGRPPLPKDKKKDNSYKKIGYAGRNKLYSKGRELTELHLQTHYNNPFLIVGMLM